MKNTSLFGRLAFSLVLTVLLALGGQSFVPTAFGCGTNAAGGTCKHADPPADLGLWSRFWIVVEGVRFYSLP